MQEIETTNRRVYGVLEGSVSAVRRSNSTSSRLTLSSRNDVLLQKYLHFLALKLNSPDDWFEKLLCYNVSG